MTALPVYKFERGAFVQVLGCSSSGACSCTGRCTREATIDEVIAEGRVFCDGYPLLVSRTTFENSALVRYEVELRQRHRLFTGVGLDLVAAIQRAMTAFSASEEK